MELKLVPLRVAPDGNLTRDANFDMMHRPHRGAFVRSPDGFPFQRRP